MPEPDLAEIAARLSVTKDGSSPRMTNYLLFETLKQLIRLREEMAIARRT